MKIGPVRGELFHVNGRTDGRMDGETDRHDDANSSFSQFLRTHLKTTEHLFQFERSYDVLMLANF
jgi:hypothetical protein